jgi:hypothetical protein
MFQTPQLPTKGSSKKKAEAAAAAQAAAAAAAAAAASATVEVREIVEDGAVNLLCKAIDGKQLLQWATWDLRRIWSLSMACFLLAILAVSCAPCAVELGTQFVEKHGCTEVGLAVSALPDCAIAETRSTSKIILHKLAIEYKEDHCKLVSETARDLIDVIIAYRPERASIIKWCQKQHMSSSTSLLHTGRKEPVTGLQGGALLGVSHRITVARERVTSAAALVASAQGAYQAAAAGGGVGPSSAGGGPDESSVYTESPPNFQLYSWESFKPVSGLLPQPEWSAWDAGVEYCALVYKAYVVICAARYAWRSAYGVRITVCEYLGGFGVQSEIVGAVRVCAMVGAAGVHRSWF